MRQEVEKPRASPAAVEAGESAKGPGIMVAGITAALAALFIVLSFGVGLYQSRCGTTSPWFAFVPLTAGGAIGVLLGFLYAAIGRESERFSAALTTVNTGLTAAAITDAAHEGSVIRQAFTALATQSGNPDRGMVLALGTVGMAAAGFTWMYLFKMMALNKFILDVMKADTQTEEDIKQVNSAMASAPLDVDRPTPVPQSVKEAAKRVSDDTSGDTSVSDKDVAKALYVQGRFTEAADKLRGVLADIPGDRSSLLYLANALLAAEKPLDAITPLEALADDPAAPVVARKLLGYAYLFLDTHHPKYREKLERSRELSSEFLRLYPQDAGAAINLACALSQLAGIDRKAYWSYLLAAVRQARTIGGTGALKRIIELTRPGQDFAPWVEDVEFKAALVEEA